jgi:hypothetical protein
MYLTKDPNLICVILPEIHNLNISLIEVKLVLCLHPGPTLMVGGHLTENRK